MVEGRCCARLQLEPAQSAGILRKHPGSTLTATARPSRVSRAFDEACRARDNPLIQFRTCGFGESLRLGSV